jgi:hypothetical protein
MEGFNAEQVGTILEANDQVVCCCLALGTANKDVALATPYPKFRFPPSEVFVYKS